MERTRGHIEGVARVRDITTACVELGVKWLSLYTFSEENWNRPAEEVNALMGLLFKCMQEEYDTMMKNGVRFMVRGNRSRLSDVLNSAISSLEEATAANSNMTMVIMLSYSGKWDILQAAQKLIDSGAKTISMEDFDAALVTAGIPDPELVIRTSGEKRISNYMLWQTAYSEFVFTDTLWPDFGKEQLVSALQEYSSRDRRFGKVK